MNHLHEDITQQPGTLHSEEQAAALAELLSELAKGEQSAAQSGWMTPEEVAKSLGVD